MANDEVKLAGQHRAIREHIKKYETYEVDYEKDFALRTIRNCQKEIQDLKRRNPRLNYSYEDDWNPS